MGGDVNTARVCVCIGTYPTHRIVSSELEALVDIGYDMVPPVCSDISLELHNLVERSFER